MSSFRAASFLLAMICTCLSGAIASQDSTAGTTPTVRIALVKLSPLLYPLLARQARISGDVKVALKIRKDGTVASAEILSGHPVLKQAALDSAQKSIFLCEDCTEDTTPYALTYTFGFRQDGDYDCGYRRFRAPRCLYLWKCSHERYVGRKPIIGESLDHVVILADAECAETMSSSACNHSP